MTTGGWLDGADVGTKVLTRMPVEGSVLVRSREPPIVPVDRCVDVRPGLTATFDGERVRLPLFVSCDGDRSRFDGHELPRVEATVSRFLRDGGRAAVRFGDRTVCRTILAEGTVDAIERRLVDAARRGGATLVTWTNEGPRDVDYRTYDTVVDDPWARSD